jgi:hypothetical protein
MIAGGVNQYLKKLKELNLKMTDDIVTRLRENCDTTDCVNVRSIDLVKCDNCEAADEIERLRKILRHVAKNNPAWADPDTECRTCNDIIKEFGR